MPYLKTFTLYIKKNLGSVILKKIGVDGEEQQFLNYPAYDTQIWPGYYTVRGFTSVKWKIERAELYSNSTNKVPKIIEVEVEDV